jgi:hypothetical protein
MSGQTAVVAVLDFILFAVVMTVASYFAARFVIGKRD